MGTSISIGTQLLVPAGCGCLQQGLDYFFLRSAKTGTVLLVNFVVRAAKPRKKKFRGVVRTVNETPTPIPQLNAMPRDEFERAVDRGLIVRAVEQMLLPPWLHNLEGLNLDHVDAERKNPAIPHAARIDRVIESIYPLVRDADKVLCAKDPDTVINRHARSCSPKQNETRMRLSFYVYILFHRNRNALHYPIANIGHWCRDKVSSVKRGRPSPRKGKGHGYNATPALIESAIACYIRERGPGVELTTIYRKFMRKDVGCQERQGCDGLVEFYHPEGKPFISKEVFEYYVRKEIGLANVQLSLYGSARNRKKIAVHQGSYAQGVCNIAEKTERDAYRVRDLAKGLLEGHTMPPLCVVRGRDVASGLMLGIGFSQGSERASAYRMELFSRAICKVKFCALFGIEITQDQWPSKGLSSWDIQDRGVGSTDKAFARDEEHFPVFREMAPSYSGQSKATIESSNPKNRTTDDAPTHVVSSMRTYELVRREIMRLLRDNGSINIGDRIPPDLLDDVRVPSPIGLYVELDKRARNDSYQLSFADAVRTFLTKLTARVLRKGVFLHSQLYNSDALKSSGLMGRARGPQEPEVHVYVLDACVRHIWMDVEGELIELDLQVPLRVGNEMVYLSLEELKEREKFIRVRDLDFSEHRQAFTSAMERQFKEATGKEWDGGSTRKGRPKRGGKAARTEAAEARASMHGQLKADR